jgi:hypothetical protein
MSYLQRLKALDLENLSAQDTVKTAKCPSSSPYGSFGRSEMGDFQKTDIPDLTAVLDEFDDRRHCRDCDNLTQGGRCLAAWRGEILATSHYHPVDDWPRRCEGYAPKAHDPDQRPGKQRWPGIGKSLSTPE